MFVFIISQCSFVFSYSQSLVNLLLTGEAVLNVWDGDRDAGGLIIKGIRKRGKIGYLTLLESLNYCHVGDHLKNPMFAVWVIGSESHFTTLFSLDPRLVYDEAPIDVGRRVFEEFSSGSGFIEEKHLPELLTKVGKEATNEYISTLKRAICHDGIVLVSDFLSEVFPNVKKSRRALCLLLLRVAFVSCQLFCVNWVWAVSSSCFHLPFPSKTFASSSLSQQTSADVPTNFVLYHCNGIAKPGDVVRYCRGVAKSINPTDIGQPEIMRCLWTKWNPLDVKWDNDQTPTIT
eukprot:m.87068 g.87068  ORF g.87068 m.87068 type:complete len:289 (+) comp12230_c0_seq4:709-1575(+)